MHSSFVYTSLQIVSTRIITRLMMKNDSEKVKKTTFSWSNLSYCVTLAGKEEKEILRNLSGEASTGELVAIMGGSGAGKTTLLNLLAGRTVGGRMKGEILLNGKRRKRSTWYQDCSYVEQDDLLNPLLTVQETIDTAANLRLPAKMTKEQREDVANEIIMDLGLNHCRNSYIGDQTTRGISGGERKRVSIGQELITFPTVMFLDEPTSGLDSSTAFNIIKTMKEIAKKRNKIVIMTIHQPRKDILDLIDQVLLLSTGKTVWLGPFSGAIDHFAKHDLIIPPNTNPSDFYLDMITIDYRTEETLAASKARVEKLTSSWERIAKNVQSEPVIDTELKTEKAFKFAQPFFRQFLILKNREMILTLRSRDVMFARLLRTFVMILAIGGVFWQSSNETEGVQNKLGVIFFLGVNQLFSISVPLASQIPQERAIIKRERAAGSYYSAAAYLAKFLVIFPLDLFFALVHAICVYFMVGFQFGSMKVLNFLVFNFAMILSSQSLGMLVGSLIESDTAAQMLSPLVAGVFTMFGGKIVNLETAPTYLRWIADISNVSYATKAMIQNEFVDADISCPNPFNVCYSSGKMVIETNGASTPGMWECFYRNIGLAAGFLILGYFAHERTSRPRGRLN